MTTDFQLLMLGAMYENGGNTTHRHLDGHPELFVYPFESQLGTALVVDRLTSLYPVKYRWPVFPLDGTPRVDYASIIDEECKVRARTPHVSKFRHMPFDFSDDERRDRYEEHVSRLGRSRGANVEAFFRATFEAWKDHRGTGEERVYVGYSPIVSVDAEAILEDLPGAQVLHVVRNPWSAYAETKRRPVPMSLPSYLLGWTTNQHLALIARAREPERVHIVRLEDLLEDPRAALDPVCSALGLRADDTLLRPSWNGEQLEEVYPWGTIRRATPDANRETAAELTKEEREEVRLRAGPYLASLGYEDWLEG